MPKMDGKSPKAKKSQGKSQRKQWPYWHLEFWTCSLQNCEPIHFCCFQPPSLWYFAMASVGNEYRRAWVLGILTGTEKAEGEQTCLQMTWGEPYVWRSESKTCKTGDGRSEGPGIKCWETWWPRRQQEWQESAKAGKLSGHSNRLGKNGEEEN